MAPRKLSVAYENTPKSTAISSAMAAASFLTVKARVVRALLELAEHLGREMESGRIVILLKIRQSDIAARAACRIHVVRSARWFLPFTSVS